MAVMWRQGRGEFEKLGRGERFRQELGGCSHQVLRVRIEQHLLLRGGHDLVGLLDLLVFRLRFVGVEIILQREETV